MALLVPAIIALRRLASQPMPAYDLTAPYSPKGDQPTAIKQLVQGVNSGERYQTLLGATGTGKTFTMANVIAQTGRPALVLAHNKTLAAQLYTEFKQFFPENAVEYFVSYYDYYQPEAYIPTTGTYIEKDLSINEEIEKLREKICKPNTVAIPKTSSKKLCYDEEIEELRKKISGNFLDKESFEEQKNYINDQVINTPEHLLKAVEDFIKEKIKEAKGDHKTYYQSKKDEIEKILDSANSLKDTTTPKHLRGTGQGRS